MNSIRVNDLDVCLSELSQRAYRAAPCELLVHVTTRNQSRALAAVAKGRYSGLRVAGVADLSFLNDCPNLRYLEVIDQKKVDVRPLDGLNNLRGLRLETPGTGLDFACFPELETFVGDWHADNVNIDRCQELRRLSLWQYKPKSLDLGPLTHVTRLEVLSITQTNITSLAGVETLEDLRYFHLSYAAALTSLTNIAGDGCELRELEITNAKKIESYEPIARLARLRRLKLSSCAAMANLKWTQGMNDLDFFSFVETNVEDGDLSPLLNLPRLRYVGTMDKKHYNYKFNAINEQLHQRQNPS